MMSFNVGGKFLDLPSDFDLQFTKKNPLFAFDDLECERTTSFRVPKTPNNMQIFGFSNDYHRRGVAMRERVRAQWQNGIVVKDGYLYVSKFSGNDFDCIFVTGELLFLRDLRELGNVNQFIDSNIICALDGALINAGNSSDVNAARVRYKTETSSQIKPSWLLPHICNMVVANSGARVDFGDTMQDIDGFRVVTGTKKGVPETKLKLTRSFNDHPTENEPYPIENNLFIDGDDKLDGIISNDSSILVRMVTNSWDNPVLLYGYFNQWISRQKIIIKFAEDTSDDIFLAEAVEGGISFLGEYSFSKNSDGTINYVGSPLAGRDVEINVGQRFILLTPDDEHSLSEAPQAVGGFSISSRVLSCDVTITGVDEQPNDAYIRARDNFPEITIVELLKTVSSLTGKILSVKDDKVVFVEDVTAGSTLPITDHITQTSDLTRTFTDYARHNIINFDRDEELNETRAVVMDYTIDNVNIDSDKELYKIPFSDGDLYFDGSEDVFTIRNEYDGYTLAVGRTGINMERIFLQKNNSLQRLLDISTSIKLQCRMPIATFEKLSAGSIIYYDGAKWIWTDAKWSKGVADLSLSKT